MRKVRAGRRVERADAAPKDGRCRELGQDPWEAGTAAGRPAYVCGRRLSRLPPEALGARNGAIASEARRSRSPVCRRTRPAWIPSAALAIPCSARCRRDRPAWRAMAARSDAATPFHDGCQRLGGMRSWSRPCAAPRPPATPRPPAPLDWSDGGKGPRFPAPGVGQGRRGSPFPVPVCGSIGPGAASAPHAAEPPRCLVDPAGGAPANAVAARARCREPTGEAVGSRHHTTARRASR